MSATENGDAVSEPASDAAAGRSPSTDPDAIERIAARARRLVRERLRAVLGERSAAAVTPRPRSEAEDAWLEVLRTSARDLREFQQSCTPGYYNLEGQPERGGFVLGGYGKGPMPFFALLADWRADGELKGLELRRPT